MDWFLYDRDLRHERIKCTYIVDTGILQLVQILKP